jgi:hypothetical protein
MIASADGELNVKFHINRSQKFLLLAASVGILWATFYQISEYGFDGLMWLVQVVVAVGIGFVGLSPQTAKRSGIDNSEVEKKQQSPTRPQIVKGMSRCTQKIAAYVPTRRLQNEEIGQYDRKHLGASLLWVKSATYAYVLVSITAQRLDPNFLESETPAFIADTYHNVMQHGWLRRFGKGVDQFPNEESKQEYAKECFQAMDIYSSVAKGMFEKSSNPFAPLYRFMESNSNLTTKQLESKYGSITRQLLQELKRNLTHN